MKGKLCATAVMSVLVGVTPTFASSKYHRTHVDRVTRSPAGGNVPDGSSFAPPRMIEVRPGVWISSYDCITDDGYGRWRPCSASSGMN
jgi:hypothetical protein